MSNYVALRLLAANELYEAASLVKFEGVWYPVLGYDPTDGQMCLENYSGPDIVIDAWILDHTDIRVDVGVKLFSEMLDT